MNSPFLRHKNTYLSILVVVRKGFESSITFELDMPFCQLKRDILMSNKVSFDQAQWVKNGGQGGVSHFQGV